MSKKDHARFSDWIERFQATLYRHALWMLRDTDLAADVVQEAFYQAWKGRKGLRETDKALPWLLSILRRRIYHEYEARDRAAALFVALPELPDIPGDDIDQASLIDLTHAMGRLSLPHREILLLYVLHGLSYEEIGTTLEIPLGTVMSRLSRARQSLAHQLSAHEQPEEAGNVIKLVSKKDRRYDSAE